jgi:putative lipoprotein (rSAM/lipoprotein system)
MTRWILEVVCVVLGALLGAACGRGPASEYGMPQTRYKLDGRVTASATAATLQGIQVTLGTTENALLATTSDDQGHWRLDVTLVIPCGASCELSVEDVDGPSNGGRFVDEVVPLDPAQTDAGDGKWDEGTFEQHDLETQLDEQ